MNPFHILGVAEDADDQAIRDAYHRAVLAHPPDRDAAAFQRIRQAYEAVEDGDARISFRLFGPPPLPTFTALLDEIDEEKKRWLGPGPWIAFLKESAG
jgi:curved DNA-binding protein CbpA